MLQHGVNDVTTDRATVTEALRFGGIDLPSTAKVLGVQHDHAMDERYRIAISLAPGDVQELLSESNFTAPLVPDSGPFMEPVQGFDLTKSTSVMSADDSIPPRGDRKQTVFRRVAVDRSDLAKPLMHLWLFTT